MWSREIGTNPETAVVSGSESSRSELARCATACLLTALGAATATSALASAPARVHQYVGLVLSPDGAQVAAVETGEQHPIVVVRSSADGKITAIFDPCEGCAYSDPAWSPDGEALAFVGWDSKARTSWGWVAQGGQELHRTASFDGLLAKPRYSVDGRTLAVLATEHPSKEADATSPGSAQVGDLDALPVDERRLAVLDLASWKFRMVSPADRYVYDYDWTPDGKGFVVSDATGDPDNNWYVAKLESVDLATGAARIIASPHTQIGSPRVSTDGRTVTFIGGLMSDAEPLGGDIWTVPFAGEPRNLTQGVKATFSSLYWRKGRLYATGIAFDRFNLYEMERDGSLKSLWSGQVTIQAGDGRVSLSADAKGMATVMQSFTIAPRIVAGRLKDLHQITFENRDLIANTDARSITYTNEGLTLQGWLLAPKNLQPGKTYAMAVYVHGGPAHFQESRFQWDNDVYALLDHGYFVFEPNYRGSFGQGDAFTRANVHELGRGDLRDILAGVDAVDKIAPVDDKRLAIFGHSYGGFLTQWAVTQTDRFKAAAASAGLSDWVSDYSLNGIPRWQDPYFAGVTPYERQDLFDQISPLRFVKQVKTPILLYGGEKDVESPIEWGIEFWHALKAVGVPTSLVIYPGEGHKFSNSANDADEAARIVAWFDKYVGDGTR